MAVGITAGVSLLALGPTGGGALRATGTAANAAAPGGQEAAPNSGAGAAAAAPPTWAVGKMTPALAGMDVDNKPWSLKDLAGRPVTVFFFCGCQPCQETAAEWATLQRGGGIPTGDADARRAATVIVFQGDAVAARRFAQAANLDLSQTVLLPDPLMESTKRWGVDPCPRAFVLDTYGALRYTNDHTDDRPQQAATSVIVAKTLGELKSVAEGPVGPPPVPDFPRVAPTGRLTVVAKDGVESLAPFAGRRWMPMVDPLKTPVVEQTFILRNDNSTPVTIRRLYVPCTCTGAVLIQAGKALNAGEFGKSGAEMTLQPGEHIEVKATIKSNFLHPGVTSEYIVAYPDQTGDKYVAVMDMSVQVQELLHFSESPLNFGEIKAGQTARKEFTTIVDARLLEGVNPARLLTNNPDVTLTAVGVAQKITFQGRLAVKQIYAATLKDDAPLGLLRGTVFFSDGKTTTHPRLYAAPTYTSGNWISLFGEKTGTLSATPKIVSLGLLAQGKGGMARVALHGVSTNQAAGLTLICDIPNVTVRIVPSVANNPELTATSAYDGAVPELTLEIMVDSNAPLGKVQGDVTVHTSNGETLLLPVMGQISGAPGIEPSTKAAATSSNPGNKTD